MKLHDYQEVARDYLRGRGRAGLFLDMGLGKTAASLHAITKMHLPVLVVAPKRVAEDVWEVEKDLFRPDLTLGVAKGEPALRTAVLSREDLDIIVLGRDNLKDLNDLKRTRPFKTIIVDELSGYKDRGSARWKMMRKQVVKPTTQYVWGLTGTPAPNGYLDLWAQIYLLDGGERLGKNITGYRDRYFYPSKWITGGTVVEYTLRPEAEDHIKKLIEDICLSMETEGRIKLPPVTINPVRIELPPKAREVYRRMAEDLVVTIKDVLGEEVIHTAANAASASSKLSQITAGFLYEDPVWEDEVLQNPGAFTPLHVEKVKALENIIQEAQGSPVLVAYRFIEEREMIKQALGSRVHTIDEPGVTKAWNRGEVPVLLAHPASAGHGLNLQHGGHTIVWASPTWDLELWDQFNKRLARQGQKHPVVIHVLLASKTVDHLIMQRLAEKSEVQQDLLQFLESPV